VIQARSQAVNATNMEDQVRAESMLSGALGRLMVVAEQYPNLKANTNFIQLQGRITDLEEKIAGQRTIFNEDANRYNIRIGQVPANFVAGFKGMQPHPLFEATAADREDVQTVHVNGTAGILPACPDGIGAPPGPTRARRRLAPTALFALPSPLWERVAPQSGVG
jgi:hypothetical protein